MKKIIIVLTLLVVFLAVAASALYRKAPALLTEALQKTLHKKVLIEDIEYSFPGTFELTGFKIVENEPFKDETLFYAKKIRFEVSPMGLFQKMLNVRKIEVDNADIFVRRFQGKFYTVFSDVLKSSSSSSTASADSTSAAATKNFPLVIDRFILTNGHFQLVDYDADENGFVIFFDEIKAKVYKINIPSEENEHTSYEMTARLVQGREQKTASVELRGWTNLSTRDTQLSVSAADFYLPYFYPYYSKVTSANIVDGFVGAKCLLNVKQNNLNLNMDIEIINLLFGSYESGSELFGLNADEIISFLKDRAGRLKFQVEAEWNLKDASIRARDVIRRSIEKSLKRTIVSNIPVLLGNAIEKLGEKGTDQNKDKIEGAVQKIKDFLKY